MARSRALKRGLPITIDGKWVLERLNVGCCEVTGIPFTFKIEETYGKYNNAQPHSPTLDRIDPKLGYTPENTMVVVAIYNFCKMHWAHRDVLHFAKQLLLKEGVG
jgi:hypothetical protein